METNALPHYDDSDNPTNCCPRFDPAGWDGVALHFENKPFARATTRAILHLPLNMRGVFDRVQTRIEEDGAYDPDNFIVLSRSLSPWQDEHLFAISGPVPEEETVTLSGDYVTKVFEGPYREVRNWHAEMQALTGRKDDRDGIYFFYTTCPRCAKTYGKNYVVGVARTG